ncbi:hypothetical protein KEM54_002615 [Ascosphaera aggregata]|nr:hypothetical protein KEM54_002615 [Ascosphaera aggregata]
MARHQRLSRRQSNTGMNATGSSSAPSFALEMTTLPSTPSNRPYASVDPCHRPPSHNSDRFGHSSAVQPYPYPSSDSAQAEQQQLPRYTEEDDPLRLSESLKSRDELKEIVRANMSLKRDSRGAKLHRFYKKQNENIHRLLRPVDEHRRQAKEAGETNQMKFKFAAYGSFIAALILAALQLYGAISSGSLSLFTTMADAVFDPLSALTLLICAKAVQRVDPRKFPAGKARIETAGNIFFCFLMTSVSFILIAFSIRDLAIGSEEDTNNFHLPSVIAVCVAFCTKLILCVYCFTLKEQYSQMQILYEDHRNDLFINGLGILTSVGGSKLRWWIDPAGALAISVLISFLWLRTAYTEFHLLIGVTADTQLQQLITYISMTHSPQILAIDTVRAYTSGPRFIVEVDIVMTPNDILLTTHDVAEDLQSKLESLPDVERAYVHVDYETTHKPEHFLKKEL